MAWHSTHDREELIIVLRGRLSLELLPARRRARALRPGQCAFIPTQTMHRLINASRSAACYVYVTGQT